MKIIALLCIALIFGLAGCSFMNTSNKVKGSGTAKSEKRSLGSFNALEVKCAGSIDVRSQGQQSFEISGDDNILPLLTTEVKNGTLSISATKDYDPQIPLRIVVSTSDLSRFVFAGAGEANLSNIKNDRVDIVMSGAGELKASGDTKEANVTLSGVGNVDTRNLHAVRAEATSTGAGEVDIYATEQLDAKTSGVGNINYYGNPKTVNKKAGGLGSIEQK